MRWGRLGLALAKSRRRRRPRPRPGSVPQHWRGRQWYGASTPEWWSNGVEATLTSRWRQELGDVGLPHVLLRDEHRPGVDLLRLALVAPQIVDHHLHPEVAHLARVLQHEAVYLVLLKSLDQLGRSVESNEL